MCGHVAGGQIEGATQRTGTQSVRLEFRKAMGTIQFNSLNEKLSKVTLDSMPVKEVVYDDKAALTTLTLNRPARAGSHMLRFSYTGVIETKPQGLFAQPFAKPDGLVFTRFESHCFPDEPVQKKCGSKSAPRVTC